MLANRCFDDFAVGVKVVTRGRTVTEADIVAFAGLTWDFYPLHTDEEHARTTRFGRRIAHGPLVYAFSVGLMPIDFFGDAIVAFLGLTELHHLAPVYPGDTLHVAAEVVSARPRHSAQGGVVGIHYSTRNQSGAEVMRADLRFLMRGSEKSATETPA